MMTTLMMLKSVTILMTMMMKLKSMMMLMTPKLTMMLKRLIRVLFP